VVACKTPEPPKTVYNPYAEYSPKDRDSIAVFFNEFSNYMSQPTARHRLYKDSAILMSPQNVEYRQILSYSYKKRGDHLKAIRILNEAVELDLKNGSRDALQYRAWSLLYYYRDYLGTIADVDKIHSMGKRKYAVCWGEPCGLLKGQALYKLGKYNEAISVFDTVLVEEVKLGFKEADNYLVHFYKGRCYHKLKNYRDALYNYQKVLAKDKDYTEALYQIGMVDLDIGEHKNAKENLNHALKLIKKGKKMGEPYFERFDEVFEYQIIDALEKVNNKF
jgi:tetratricopeptide (TPR) repeat protein